MNDPIEDENENISDSRKLITLIDNRLMVAVMLWLFLLIFFKVWSVLSLHIPGLIVPTFLSRLKSFNDPLPFHVIILGLIVFNSKTKTRSEDRKITWLSLLVGYLIAYDLMVGLLVLDTIFLK